MCRSLELVVVEECSHPFSSRMPDWYYLDGGLWSPFDSTISAELENIFQSNNPTGTFADFTVDFREMTLKRDRKRTRILIKRADMAANPSNAWEWEMDGVWHPYDFFDSDFLCLVASKPHLTTTVLYLGPNNTPYEIDTQACTQKNMKTKYRRFIRQVPISIPPSPASAPAPLAVPAPAPAPAPNLSSTNAQGSSSVTQSPPSAVSSLDLTGVHPGVRSVLLACTRIDCNEDCVICMDPFDDVNGVAHSLPDCLNHGFHLECIKNQLMSQGKCPICNKIYIINEGTQPKNGTMSVTTNGRSLPGFRGCGTIEMLNLCFLI